MIKLKYYNRFIISIALLCLYSVSKAQFADKAYYLVDSLNYGSISNNDQHLLDSCLKLYHASKIDTAQLNIIASVVENSWDDNVWPKYNELIIQKSASQLSNPFYIEKLAGAYNNQGYYFKIMGQLDKALIYYNKSLNLRKKQNDQLGIAQVYNNIANFYYSKSNRSSAIEYFRKSMNIYSQENNQDGLSSSLVNIGALYYQEGKLELALDYYHKSLAISEQIKNNGRISSNLNNIAVVYENQGDLTLALQYYNKSFALDSSISNKRGMAQILSNIGFLNSRIDSLQKAIIVYNRCLNIQRELGYKEDEAITLINLSKIYLKLNQPHIAKQYALECLAIRNKVNDEIGISNAYQVLAEIEMAQQDVELAIINGEKSIEISQRIGYPTYIKDGALTLFKAYKQNGDFKAGLKMYELHIQMRDSINNEATQKATIRQQTKYEFEKQQLSLEQEEKEKVRALKAKEERRNNLQYSIIFLGILLFFGLILGLGFIKVSPTIAEGLIFFAFLILFEFLLVLSDSFVDQLTSGEPIYKLLANAVLAGAIFPAHAFFEKALKSRIVN